MILLAVLLSLPLVSLTAIRYPISPTEPQVSGSEPQESNKKKVTVKNIPVQVKLKLGSGDELEGIVHLPESITFSHEKNGLVYSKTIHPSQLKKITVTEYSARKSKDNLFEFEPATITLITEDNREFNLRGIFSFLRKITIETLDGKTTVFTIFADRWDDKTGWSEVDSKEFYYHRKNPHPKAVKEIIVTGAASATGDNLKE